MAGAMIGTAILGLLIERVASANQKGTLFAPLIATIGITIILQEVANKIFGRACRLLKP
jgi:branched-subunit amino acid ABC-type transport system permease component